MRSAIVLATLLVGCSGSLTVIGSDDGGKTPEASVDAAPPPTYVDPECTSTPKTLSTGGFGGPAPMIIAGGWLYWTTATGISGMQLVASPTIATIVQRADDYQSFASDGTTLYFSSPTGIGTLPIGGATSTWSTKLGGTGSLAVDATKLYYPDWQGTHVYAVDKTNVDASPPTSLGIALPSTDAGQELEVASVSLTSQNLVLSIFGGNSGDWSAGSITAYDKNGANAHALATAGNAGAIADDKTVAWVEPFGWTIQTTPLAGGTTTATGAPVSYLAQNADAFFGGSPQGIYRVSKSDGKVTQLTTEPSAHLTADSKCVFYYAVTASGADIHMIAATP